MSRKTYTSEQHDYHYDEDYGDTDLSSYGSYGSVRIKKKKSGFAARASKYLLAGLLGATVILVAERNYNLFSFFDSQPVIPSQSATAYWDPSTIDQNPNLVTQITSLRYSDELLEGMGQMMEEMNYKGLTKAHLIALRDRGITATFISQVRDLGYDDLTLNDAVRLKQRDVSARFMTMMQQLGYSDLSIDDLVRLRDNGVTAYFTSNMHDLGFKNLTQEELIRLKRIGASVNKVKRYVNSQVEQPSFDELTRYLISNQ